MYNDDKVADAHQLIKMACVFMHAGIRWDTAIKYIKDANKLLNEAKED